MFPTAECRKNEFVGILKPKVSKLIDETRQIKRAANDQEDSRRLAPLQQALDAMQIALRRLEQNVDIPKVRLEFNPHILRIVEAARAQGRKPNEADLGELIQDSEFLDSLQNGVNKWIQAIRKATKLELEWDPSSGTALQEATFWMNLEKELARIQEMRKSDEVVATLDALKAGKRFQVALCLDENTGWKEMLAKAQEYNRLIKDIPLNELVIASDFQALRIAIGNIFANMKKFRYTKYPLKLKRSVQFIMAISTDCCEQMIQLLKPRLLMHAPMSELEEVMEDCKNIFDLLDNKIYEIKQMFDDIAKKQRAKKVKLYRTDCRYRDLEKRLEELHEYRKAHEQLSSVISRVLRHTRVNFYGGINTNLAKEVDKAYEAVKEVPYLDLTQAGQQTWDSSMQYYNALVCHVETQLASRFRDELRDARNADEMFTILTRYNALFVRPQIRSAICEHQTTLIDQVKADIVTIQETIMDDKIEEMALRVADSLDIPPFSAKVMWLKQNESWLKMNMKRIEDVLGEQWTEHVEGEELKKECEVLRRKLDTQQMFTEWCDGILSKCKTSTDKLFCVEKLTQPDGKTICRIRVNFSPDSLTIEKEVRNLKNMGFRIPFKIMSHSHNINAYCPYAVSLLESIRIYESTNELINSRPCIVQLVAGYRKNIHDEWSNFKLESYAGKFNKAVSNYQEKVTDLIEYLEKIELELSALDKCQYKRTVISQILDSIQKVVDQMALNNYSNMNKWIENLDKILEAKLARCLEEAIHVWTTVLKQSRNELEDGRGANIKPVICTIPLEISIVAQQVTVLPTLEKLLQLKQNQDIDTYKGILLNLLKKQQVLTEAYEAINAVVKKVDDYASHWIRYQALWDLQPDILFEQLGTDLNNWMKVIMEMRKSRRMIDSPESQNNIFPFVVDYTRVQSKLALRYDYWRREVLSNFGVTLGASMQNFVAIISKARTELESQSIDPSNTRAIVALVTHVQNLKKQLKQYQEQVDNYIAAQKLLIAHRFAFPRHWLYVENVEGEWSALLDVLERKEVAIVTQQIRIMEEEELLEKHINDVIADWNKLKPVNVLQQQPQQAIIQLDRFEDKFKRLKDERAKIVEAKNALEINESLGHVSHQQEATNKLDEAIEELVKLQGIWKAFLPGEQN